MFLVRIKDEIEQDIPMAFLEDCALFFQQDSMLVISNTDQSDIPTYQVSPGVHYPTIKGLLNQRSYGKGLR